ncbi:MAG: hypothetical protein H0X33_05440 [Taibaiella sp.]|nr:hypothetical protein [Taibaiella sp.]
MLSFIKYVFLFLCLALASHMTTAIQGDNKNIFDPMDTDDSVSITQNLGTIHALAHAEIITQDWNSLQDHKGKPTRAMKHLSSELCYGMPVRKIAIAAIPEDVVHFTPAKSYTYLFFCEINPPPPKVC